MASINVTLAWSVPVKVDVLAAHLQAYASTHQTIHTLRMCHRFGRGEGVWLPQLPIELVEHIGTILAQEKRAEELPIFQQMFQCWQGLCRPTDHVEEGDLREIYLDYHEEDDYSRQCNILTPEILAHFDEILLRDLEHPSDCTWLDPHEYDADQWSKLVDHRDLSIFTKHADLFLRDFGLEVFTTHNQFKQKQTEQQIDLGGTYPTTIAYLTLPSPSLAHSYKQAYLGMSHHTGYHEEVDPIETDGGFAAPVVVPPALSIADVQRFHRAFKLLALAVPDNRESETVNGDSPSSSRSPSSSITERKGPNETPKKHDVDLTHPQLRLLVRSSTECGS